MNLSGKEKLIALKKLSSLGLTNDQAVMVLNALLHTSRCMIAHSQSKATERIALDQAIVKLSTDSN